MKTFILLSSLLITSFIFGQYPDGLNPLKSPHKTASTTIGLGEVSVDYYAPSVRGRKVWGELVIMDKVWRLGANKATTLTTTTALMIGDKTIPADTFALFLMPASVGDWTLIINSEWNQWGAYGYDESKDVARIRVSPVELNESVEQLEIGVREFEEGTGTLWIKWDNMQVSPLLSVNIVEQFNEIAPGKIENAGKEEKWAAYLSAAEFLVNYKENLPLAAEWISKAEKEYEKFGKKYAESESKEYYEGHLLWTKAKIYNAMGKKNKAIKLAKEVIENKSDRGYFIRRGGVNRENIEATVSSWKD